VVQVGSLSTLTGSVMMLDSMAAALRQLYRDAITVREILRKVDPGGSSRVALSLGDVRRGPFIIVDREGHFITALGEGMRPHPDQPAVPFDKVMHVLSTVSRLRDRFEAARRLSAAETRGLLRRVLHGGDTVTKEEFLALSHFARVARRRLHTIGGLVLGECLRAGRSLRKAKGERAARIHREYWQLLWGAAHFEMVVADPAISGGPRAGELSGALWFLGRLTQFGPLVVRGLWAAGMAGPAVMEKLEAAVARDRQGDSSIYVAQAAAVVARSATQRLDKSLLLLGAHVCMRGVTGNDLELDPLFEAAQAAVTALARQVWGRRQILGAAQAEVPAADKLAAVPVAEGRRGAHLEFCEACESPTADLDSCLEVETNGWQAIPFGEETWPRDAI
jgi:hypothetical protein